MARLLRVCIYVMCTVLLDFSYATYLHDRSYRDAFSDEIDDKLLKKGCGNNPADIVFVLDESGSIWGPDFDRQIEFVKEIIKVFDVGLNRTHIGAITFATDEKIYFTLGQITELDGIEEALGNIQQRRGGTRTFDAIRKMRTTMFSHHYQRSWVPHICILITDGESENPDRTAAEAKKARDAGITMFAIGVGLRINKDELRNIANEPVDEFTYTVNNYEALMKLRDILAFKTCQVTTLPPPTTTTTTTTTTTMPTTTLPQMIEGCAGRYPMDIMFALPDQAGIDNTDQALDLVGKVVGETEISPVQVQVGMTPRYCDGADGIRLADHDTRRGFLNNLERRKLTGTRTDKHLEFMYTHGIAPKNGGRDDAAKFGILVIDNQSDDLDETLKHAQNAKKDMHLIVIGVGDHVSDDELKAIATDDKSVFKVDDYNALGGLSEDIVNSLCSAIRDFLDRSRYSYIYE